MDIRPLTSAQDSTLITGTNIDVRRLTGVQDTVTIAQANYAYAEASGSVIIGGQNYLTRDLSPYKENIYRVENTGLTLAITVQLQIAPIDSDAYYVADGSSFNLLAGGVLFLRPTRLMRYARVRVSVLLSVGQVSVQYFGRA